MCSSSGSHSWMPSHQQTFDDIITFKNNIAYITPIWKKALSRATGMDDSDSDLENDSCIIIIELISSKIKFNFFIS